MEMQGLQNSVASRKHFDKLLSPRECCELESALLDGFCTGILMCDFIYMRHLLLE